MSKNKVTYKSLKDGDETVWLNLNEATSTGVGSGPYKPPISPGLKIWDKNILEPFTQPLSNYVNAELQYDSLDGIMSSKNIKTKEHKSQMISKSIKRKNSNQDDDGLGAGRPSTLSSGTIESSDNNLSENVRINKEKLVEDLAVWFGTKKKPKGSKQPKGPWVNICRKKEGGGHPPCGRSDTSKGAYPKCRAAGVASKMSDSQKKAACSQKRKAEKKDTQTGKGQKPVYTSYKPKKKTKKESIIDKKILIEKFKVGNDEYEKLYEDDNFLLVIPFTHEASCKYGAGTKWCTTGRDDKGMEWFEKHNRIGALGYLIIKNKELSDKVGSTKFGLYINKPGMNYLGGNYAAPLGIIIYDDRNNPIHIKVLANVFDRENLYGKLSMILNKFVQFSQDKFENVDTDYEEVK